MMGERIRTGIGGVAGVDPVSFLERAK